MTATRTLLRCGAAAGPLFLATATIEGSRRADYSPVRHPISALARGPRGQVQVANFCVTGSLYLAASAGLRRRGAAPAWVAVATAGASLIVSGVCVCDPVSGYPPGADPSPTPTGNVHNLSGIPIFLGLPIAQLATAWQSRRDDRAWAAYGAGSAVTMLAGFGPASAAFAQQPRLVPYGGLFQRVAVVSGLGWITALCQKAAAAQSN